MWSTTRCASLDDRDIYVVGECAQHRGHVYGLVAPLWEQAKVLADHITGTNPNAAYHGSKVATKLKVMGVEMAAMGITEPVDERDEIVQFTEPKKGTYKKLIIRDGRLVGGISARRHQQGCLPDAGFRPQHAAARRTTALAVRYRRAVEEGHDRGDARRHAGLQLQRRQQRRDSWRASRAGKRTVPKR